MLQLELFISFALVGICCVGGGYASIPLIQQEVVVRHSWLTITEFLDIVALSQMTPGPIGINAATFVGTKVAGLTGSISATLGFIAPSFFIMLAIAYVLKVYGNLRSIKGILNGLSAAVVALITSAGLMFLTLCVYQKQRLSEVLPILGEGDFRALAVIAVTLYVYRRKYCGVIQTLVLGGVLNLLLHWL